MNELKLHTAGYPRSGNKFLNHALKAMYYPQGKAKNPTHSFDKFEETGYTVFLFAPFRNPLDAISSWNTFKKISFDKSLKTNLELDIEDYISFNSYLLANINKITLLDFDNFTIDLSYISKKVLTASGISPIENPTIEEVKQSMIETKEFKHLPQNNEKDYAEAKAYLLDNSQFQNCVDVYNHLKAQA